jgi:hypothetical protein
VDLVAIIVAACALALIAVLLVTRDHSAPPRRSVAFDRGEQCRYDLDDPEVRTVPLLRRVLAAADPLEQVFPLHERDVDLYAEGLRVGLVAGLLNGVGDLDYSHGLAVENLVQSLGERLRVPGTVPATRSVHHPTIHRGAKTADHLIKRCHAASDPVTPTLECGGAASATAQFRLKLSKG